MAIQIQVKRGVLANRPALQTGEFYWATDTNQLFIGPTPTLVNSSGGGGASGTAIIDFGAFPGSSNTSLAITGQVGILASSKVNAWLTAIATTDHTADEHLVEPVRIFAGNIVAGTGFTIYAVNHNMVENTNTKNPNVPTVYGKWSVTWQWS